MRKTTSLPILYISVERLGTNSLLGAVTQKIDEFKLLSKIEQINFHGLIFTIKNAHSSVDVFEEIKKVRDFLKIEEDKIQVFLSY